MGALEEAQRVLQTAESDLRAILVQAAASGDYDHVTRIAAWAKLLNAVLGDHAVAETSATPELNLSDVPEPPEKKLHERSVGLGTRLGASDMGGDSGGRR